MSLTEGGRRRPHSPLLTVAAYGSLVVPFGIVLIRLAGASHRVFLPDDLALVDLHTRVALAWHQAVGPFDRFGWNHPGPAYYYLLAVVYRVVGDGARAAFIGASLINLLAALGVVAVARRRGGPVLALWAAACVGALEIILSITTPGALTYSEGALGAGVSPWTATVIIVPLLLCAVLCAAAATPSPLSFLGALVVGSFVIQTDFSAAALVGILLLASVVAGGFVVVRDRRGTGGGPAAEDRSAAAPPPAPPPTPPPTSGARRWPVPVLAVLGVAVVVGMWIPPVVQNMTNHPGNLDLIYRFFTSKQPVHPVSQGFWATVAVAAVSVFGPGEIMSTALGRAPAHAPVALVVFVLLCLVAAEAVRRGMKESNRFAVTLGAFSLLGLLAMIVVFSRISGLIYGYLVLWEITMPIMAVLALGATLINRSPARHSPPSARRSLPAPVVVGGLVVVTAVILCVRMLSLPALGAVSDPKVNAVVALVRPELPRTGAPVFVGDAGLDLIETEEFIGVVNELDATGHHPKVNHFWRSRIRIELRHPGRDPLSCHPSPMVVAVARSLGLPRPGGGDRRHRQHRSLPGGPLIQWPSMTYRNEDGRPEPPVAGDETDTLLGSLDRQRAIFEWKTGGLDEAGLQAKVGLSSITLGGLLKHMALVEDEYFTRRLAGRELGSPWDVVDFEADPDWEWHSAASDSPTELEALWRHAVGRVAGRRQPGPGRRRSRPAGRPGLARRPRPQSPADHDRPDRGVRPPCRSCRPAPGVGRRPHRGGSARLTPREPRTPVTPSAPAPRVRAADRRGRGHAGPDRQPATVRRGRATSVISRP